MVSKIKPPTGSPTYFYYDGRLNRYLIDKAGTLTYYLWDGLNQLEERDVSGTLLARYTHGNYRQYGIGSVVEVERHVGAATYYQYPLCDHRGTVYAMVDANQNTQLSYTMDAFGRQLAGIGGAQPTVPNDLIYQTNWLTLQIGGRWYGVSKYRLYDMELGVFLQRDFLPYLNKYRAWSNNPVGQVDRNGLFDAASHGTGPRFETASEDPLPGFASVFSSKNRTTFAIPTLWGEFKKGPTLIPIGAPSASDPTTIDLDPMYGGGSIGEKELNDFIKEHANTLPDLRNDTPYEQALRLKGILALAKSKYAIQHQNTAPEGYDWSECVSDCIDQINGIEDEIVDSLIATLNVVPAVGTWQIKNLYPIVTKERIFFSSALGAVSRTTTNWQNLWVRLKGLPRGPLSNFKIIGRINYIIVIIQGIIKASEIALCASECCSREKGERVDARRMRQRIYELLEDTNLFNSAESGEVFLP